MSVTPPSYTSAARPEGGSPLNSLVVLGREVFTVPEAARQLAVPDSTLRWWLEGRKKDDYRPVLRAEATGSTNVTWGEFVEAGYLREYRKKDVPLPNLRRLIDFLRDRFGVPYPLAHYKPWVGEGRRLLLEAQAVAELPAEFWLVVGAEGHEVLLTPPSDSFLERVEFAPSGDEWAERIYPDGKESPVVMDPELSSGAPTVSGIRTENLVELVDAGEPIEEVAETFGLSELDLKAALSFEWARAKRASVANPAA